MAVVPVDVLQERFWQKVDWSPDGCWLWTGATRDGYGRLSCGDAGVRLAHRLSYEWYVGPIPDGLHLDHLCRTPSCVRPDHLEAVTQRINSLRGVGAPAVNARKTHCIYGHEYTAENTVITSQGWRRCLTCKRAYEKTHKKALRAANRKPPKTHCPRGHEYSEENTYRHGNHRYCRTCNREGAARRRREALLEGFPVVPS